MNAIASPYQIPLFRPKQKRRRLECLVTLSPGQENFAPFACDPRLAGIRINNFGLPKEELKTEFELLKSTRVTVPLYSDVKARQIRVEEVIDYPGDHLELIINHPIEVATPLPVLFKAGTDHARLLRLEDNGKRLVFQGGPRWKVRPGESLHLRHRSLTLKGPIFVPMEKEKIELALQAGFKRFFLSYVEGWREVDELLELVGKDAEIWLKIETVKGLEFVAHGWKKRDNLTLVAARGDLFVEVERPHHILEALKLIIEKDPDACAGSRILLSLVENPALPHLDLLPKIERLLENIMDRDPGTSEVVRNLDGVIESLYNPVPSCADIHDIGWLYEHGYRRMLLCDNLYLRKEWIDTALTILGSFRQ